MAVDDSTAVISLQVFQLGVELQPSSSEALAHLGNAQLAEHEATGEQEWLTEAELSFRASLLMEGKPIAPQDIPEQLAAQKWWKKKVQEKTAASNKVATAASNAHSQKSSEKGAAMSKQPSGGIRAQPAKGRGGGAPQPQANRKSVGSTASRKPTKPTAGPAAKGASAAASQPSQTSKTAVKGGKNVATLGELKAGESKKNLPTKTVSATPSQESMKPAESSKPEIASSPVKQSFGMNKKTYVPRLGLARVLAKTPRDKDKLQESCTLYNEVISISPDLHDAYIELGEMLSKTDPVAAVDAFSRFPFSDPPSFNDAYLHGEIVRLLMASEQYDDSRLQNSMVAMGQALGIAVLEKQVSILENKFKTDLLKKVYAGVHGKPVDDPDLQAFFKFKCWR